MLQKNYLFTEFVKAEEARFKIPLNPRIEEYLEYQQYVIRKEYDKLRKEKTKQKMKRVFLYNQFIAAFESMSKQERVEYYINMVNKIQGVLRKDEALLKNKDVLKNKEVEVYIRSLRRWKKKILRINRSQLKLQLQKQGKIKNHDLNNYLYRKSKNSQYFSFVLQAINQNPKSKYKTMHLGFASINSFSQWSDQAKACIDFALVNYLCIHLNIKILPIVDMTQKINKEDKSVNLKFQNQTNKISQQQYNKQQLKQESTNNQQKKYEIGKNNPPQRIIQKTIQKDIETGTQKSEKFKQRYNTPTNIKQGLKNKQKIQEKLISQFQQNERSKSKTPSKKLDQQKLQLKHPIQIQNNLQIINNQSKQKDNLKTKENYINASKSKVQKSSGRKLYITKSIIQSNYQLPALESQPQQSDNQNQKDIEKKSKKPNLFHQIMPEYNIQSLTDQQDMITIQSDRNHKLLQNNKNKKQFKLFFNLKFKADIIFHYLTHLESFKIWNSQVEELIVKNMIASQNTAIIYQKLKPYSKIYRSRDFVFLRHAFKKNNNLYIIDKSIQNVNHPPFLTIVRGNLRCIWGIIPNNQNQSCLVVIDLQINNQGYLNQQQNMNLSMQYLKKLFNIQNFMIQQTFNKQECIYKMFDIQDMNEQQEIQQSIIQKENNKKEISQLNDHSQGIQQEKKREEKEKKQQIIQNQNHLKQIQLNKQQSIRKNNAEQGEGQIQELKNQFPSRKFSNIPQLDQNGFSIINYNFLKIKHKLMPWERQLIFQDNYKEHHIWKGQWGIDKEKGGMWYIDQKKMAEQKKVLSYIVSKIGKNILSGKGILNVSLPVDIFCPQSNLERLAMTFAYAPIYLQKAARISDPLLQMKEVFIFGITTSLLYLTMQKPFNPILGETFQCSYNGSPVYMEQISHHPPISSFYMVGRGYKFYGSIQSKMQLYINSGCGINDGNFVVQFENGTQFKFRTPGGQISGLTYGDRKLNLVGKSYYWEPKLGYFLDITFNPGKKGFFSLSRQQLPTDYFEGVLKKVRREFIIQFQDSKNKQSPTANNIIQEYYKYCGNWNKQIMIDGKKVFNIDNQKYIKMEYEYNPLPSDCNYRQDVIYRRLNNINRSQNQKQKYQIIQRKDRKLRQSYQKKKK